MSKPAATWLYKLVNGPLSESQLNDLGAHGWELVSHEVTFAADASVGAEVWVFKQEK